MKKDDRVYLRHVLDAIEQIETYAAGVSRQLFLDTRLLQDAVSRQLEIMGEACRNLSEPLRLAHPGVPWAQIIGLRNRLTHAYFSVNYQTVWEVIDHDLPQLKHQIVEILETLDQPE